MKRILSLEGGGCRGVMILSMLKELYGEKFVPRDNYDLIAGTSVGGLLTGLFITGYDVGTVQAAFHKWLPIIFASTYVPWGPKYGESGINSMLERMIGNLTFSQIMTTTKSNFIITTYSTSRDKGTYFKSNKPEHQQLRLRDAMRASMSAPYYFPSCSITLPGNKYEDIYVDGGLSGNNDPSAIAFTEAIKFLGWKNEDIRMDSFGCGKYIKPKKPGFPSFVLSQLLRVMDALFKSATDNVEQTMGAICDIMPKFSYCRYNPELPEDYALDDLEDVGKMERIAEEYIKSKRCLMRHKF